MRRIVALACGVLAGCGTVTAPIEERRPPPRPVAAKPVARPVPKVAVAPGSPSSAYTVQKGDTLFSIAFANGLDVRELAAWNDLPSPDLIRIGQVLRLTAPASELTGSSGVETMPIENSEAPPEIPVYTTPRAQRLPWSDANWAKLNSEAEKPVTAAESPNPPEKAEAEEAKPDAVKVEPAASPETWRWPASGALLGRYGEGGGKGIDLAGERGAPVVAAAPGRVVYSGSGLRGYGQLVIIKHANEYLSAYAHNQKILVHEGELVTEGQKIAEMGDSDADRVKLHFEIRQFGKPVDPLKLLPDHS